jgi:hypothetical protein
LNSSEKASPHTAHTRSLNLRSFARSDDTDGDEDSDEGAELATSVAAAEEAASEDADSRANDRANSSCTCLKAETSLQTFPLTIITFYFDVCFYVRYK